MVNFRELSIRKVAAAVGGLVVAAGAAYYYYVYLPQLEQESARAVQQAAKPPAGAKPAKPPVVPVVPAASAVPAVSGLPAPVSAPVAAPVQAAVITEVATAAPVPPLDLALEPAPKQAKPRAAIRKAAPKKPRIKTPPTPVALPESGVAATEPRIIAPKYNDVLTAVLRSDREGVKQLLDLGRWVDKPGASGLTPLMAAVMNRDTNMVELLLDRGAVPGPRAIEFARKNKDDATVSLLERHGAR